ncbi:hypothetical protein D918_02161 [Trichuris suis]
MSDVCRCLVFPDRFADESSVSPQWISYDELLVSFENSFIIFTFDPFGLVEEQEIFPIVKCFHAFDRDCFKGLMDIVNEIVGVNLENYIFTASLMVSADNYFIFKSLLGESIFSSFLKGGKPTVAFDEVYADAVSEAMCTLLAVKSEDGQMHIYVRNTDWEHFLQLSDMLVACLKASCDMPTLADILGSLSSQNGNNGSVDEAIVILRLCLRLATKVWHWTSMKMTCSRIAIAVQCNGDVVFWKFTNTDKPEFQVVKLEPLIKKERSLTVWQNLEEENGGVLFVGTSDGEVYYFKVLASQATESITVSEQIPLKIDLKQYPVTALSVRRLGEERYSVYVATAIELCVVQLEFQRLPPAADPSIQMRIGYEQLVPISKFIFTSDSRYATSEATFNKFTTDDTTGASELVCLENYEEARIQSFGTAISWNGVFLISCNREIRARRKKIRNNVEIRRLISLDEHSCWNRILLKGGNWIGSNDLLILLRVWIYTEEGGAFVSRELAKLTKHLDQRSLQELKLLRFCLIMFKQGNLPCELEQEAMHKSLCDVTLRLAGYHAMSSLSKAKEIIGKAKGNDILAKLVKCSLEFLNATQCTSYANPTALTTDRQFGKILKEEVDSKYFECPACLKPFAKWENPSSRTCINGHCINFCALTFQPLLDFDLCKCSRCGVLASQDIYAEELKDLFAAKLCPYCDGFVVKIPIY